MLAISVRRGKLLTLFFCVVAIVSFAVSTIYVIRINAEIPAVKISCADDGVRYLASLGYSVTPNETKTLTLPRKFDTLYTRYNSVLKESGYDLAPYRGRQVRVFSYKVSPGDSVYSTLYVCDGVLVAADIYDAKINGYIKGLEKNANRTT